MKIAGFPFGLLSLLDSKNFGQNPDQLNDAVASIVDLTGLYLLQKAEVFASTAINPLVAGTNVAVGMVVPTGEVWRIHQASAFVSAGAGAAANFTLVVTGAGTFTAISQLQVVAATQERLAPMISGPLWLTSGMGLAIRAHEVTLAPVASVTAMISRLKA